MPIIAVAVNNGWKIKRCTNAIANAVRQPFEALNFGPARRWSGKNMKLFYIMISEKQDPALFVEYINSTSNQMRAFIPKDVPDITLAKKPKPLDTHTRKRLNIAITHNLTDAIILTHVELLLELQYKYTGLFNLSEKTNHILLDKISNLIFERLKKVINSNQLQMIENCFDLSKLYRKAHPHFTDFQCIMSNLHEYEDANKKPRTQLSETELINAALDDGKSRTDTQSIMKTCHKYTDKINEKITEYISTLDCEINETDSEEEKAKKTVRIHLKKLIPFMPAMVRQVISKHMVENKSTERMRIYGEPFLPNKHILTPFLKNFRPIKPQRSDQIYNLLKFNIPYEFYNKLMKLDGTTTGGAKLTIRSFLPKLYKPQPTIAKEIRDFVASCEQDDERDQGMEGVEEYDL